MILRLIGVGLLTLAISGCKCGNPPPCQPCCPPICGPTTTNYGSGGYSGGGYDRGGAFGTGLFGSGGLRGIDRRIDRRDDRRNPVTTQPY
jgi:hypothetical protein